MQGRNLLSLHDLGQSNHLLVLEGNFYNDPLVAHTSSMTASFDLDSLCLVSRELAERVYTDV